VREIESERANNLTDFDGVIDHGKSDELASGPNWKKIARFKRLESSSLKFQNDLAFLGRIGKPSLSEFPEIYDGVEARWKRTPPLSRNLLENLGNG
jgi:hypothetical protein